MANLNSIDAQLLQIVSGASPASITDAITLMQKIDGLLPSSDGLKWFNRLYMTVTQRVAQPPTNGWKDAAWLTRLDVVFAGFYFAAIARALERSADTPSSWDVLFVARNRTGVDRIQFALAGMNAHINHDLALARLQTDDELHRTPGMQSPEHDDYEHVNCLLEEVLPSALNFLATGIIGELVQDTGRVGHLLAMWNVRAARNLAWDFADNLRNLRGVSRDLALKAQDQLTGGIGYSLLVPVHQLESIFAATYVNDTIGVLRSQLRILAEEPKQKNAELARKPVIHAEIGSVRLDTNGPMITPKELTDEKTVYEIIIQNTGDLPLIGGLVHIAADNANVKLSAGNSFPTPLASSLAQTENSILVPLDRLNRNVWQLIALTAKYPKGTLPFAIVLTVDADNLELTALGAITRITPPRPPAP